MGMLVRGSKRLGIFLWNGKKHMENEEAPNFLFKSPFCPIPDRLYRYMFKLYRYNFATATFLTSCTGTCLSCTGTIGPKLIFFLFFSSFFFKNIYICFFFSFHLGVVVLMYNLTFQLPFISGLAACSLFLLFRFHS